MSTTKTRLESAAYATAEEILARIEKAGGKSAEKVPYRDIVNDARKRLAQAPDGLELSPAAVNRLLLHAIGYASKYSFQLTTQQQIRFLETIFGMRMPAKLQEVAPAMEAAINRAEDASRAEIRELTRGRGVGRATSVDGLKRELGTVMKLAVLGEWPASSQSWLERAQKAGVDLETLARFFDLQRVCWEVRLANIPQKLMSLAENGKWDAALENDFKVAAFYLSRDRFGLSNARHHYETYASRVREKKAEAKKTAAELKRATTLDTAGTSSSGVLGRVESLDEVEALRKACAEFVGKSLAAVEKTANEALRKAENADFDAEARVALDRRWGAITRAIDKLLPTKGLKDPAARELAKAQRRLLLDKSTWVEKMSSLAPDLRMGEQFAADLTPAPIVYAGADDTARLERRELIEALVRIAPPATELDGHLLKRVMNALHIDMLRDLKNAGYTVTVSRFLLTNAEQDLVPLVGVGEGIHVHDGGNPRIAVRSYWQDGALQLDVPTLLHEIGHAYDLRIRGSLDTPMHLSPALVEAFRAEHPLLPSYFHDQKEFIAEALARFLGDSERASGQLYATSKALEAIGFEALRPDVAELAKVQAEQVSAAAVSVTPDPWELLSSFERRNALRARQKTPLEPYVFELDGTKDQGSALLAASLAHALRRVRAPGVPPYKNGEELVRVPAAVFNDAQKLDALLKQTVTDQRGCLLYFDELAKIPADSPGFALLTKHVERFGGIAPILLEGPAHELDRFKTFLPTSPHPRLAMAALSASQVAENVERRARGEGFAFSREAAAAFAQRSREGGLQRAYELWHGVKEAHASRVDSQMALVERDPQAVMRILARDVVAANLPEQKDPVARFQALVGLSGAKAKLRQILGHLSLGGDPSMRPRLNLLFSGNPGTGKTTVAELFAEILHEKGYLKKKTVAKPLLQTILDGNPAANVRKLFEDNKGGVIFFDEFHQLQDSEAGKQAFRAMIPYLGNAEYTDTVFIGAGYDDELKSMIRDIDKGAERRFAFVPFDDYSKDEQGQILDKMAREKRLELTPEVREAAIMRLAREQRCMMNFGNAGTVETVLGEAFNRCVERLASADEPDPKALGKLIAEDFAAPLRVTKQDVWRELDELRGLESVKKQLKKIGASIDVARSLGEDPLAAVEPYIFIEGPAGTGKSTLARILARFFAAYDIVPTDKLVERVGPDMQGEFVGQTPRAVKEMFRDAWGGTLFIDEAAGLAKAGGTFKDEVVKTMLPMLENNRGRFIVVLADYPEGRDLFNKMDGGLARRFGLVMKTEKLGPQDAADETVAQLAKRNRELPADLVPVLRGYYERLFALSNYASGGDVRTLTGAIMSAHASTLSDLLERGEAPANPRAIQRDSLVLACEEFLAQKADDARRSTTTSLVDDPMYATQAQVASRELARESDGSPHDRVLAALEGVNARFATQYQNDPLALMAAQKDAASDYIKALAEQLGVTPDEAVASLTRTTEAIGKGVKVRSLKQRFEYHCPFCGGIDSPSCAYRSMPLEWKIANSLKKPWTETVEEVIGGKP